VLVPLIVAAALIVVVLLWLGLRGGSDEAAPGAAPVDAGQTATTTGETEAATVDETPEPPAPHVAEPAAEPERDARPTLPPERAAAAPMNVSAHGVGTGVVNHRIVGESDRFTAGSRVWFWTRVEGGGPGRYIRHVWLHEGNVVEGIRLRVGSARWRTQSSKTLYSTGRWAVEARDEAGSVLARSEFTATR
jgi:hypothetical protein